MPQLTAVILAAGLGTRMKSPLPKVMHPIAGRPLVHYAVRAAFQVGVERAVVVTSGRPELDESLAQEFGERVQTVVQDPPRGTGDAARVGLELVETEQVLILCGDTPLIRPEELTRLIAALSEPGASELALLTCTLDAPHGYLLPFEALAKALQGGKPAVKYGDPTAGLGYGPIDRSDGLDLPGDAAALARRRLQPLVERMRGDHGFEVGP